MSFEIVGREQELGTIDAFVGRAAAGPAALVLEGEAGIGTTTLWRSGVGAARTRGLRVLSARPAEVERDLAYVGLRDLLEDVLPEVSPMLPAARRHALEAAPLLRCRCRRR
jgi:predicted ATPase